MIPAIRISPLGAAIVATLVWNAVGHLNLYLNPTEVMRILGVAAEVYYVREGTVNNYALNFVLPMPTNLDHTTFTWQSLTKPLSYKIDINTSHKDALSQPKLNISELGEIPTTAQTFSIVCSCIAKEPIEVDVIIKMDVTLNHASNNITHLSLRRKKICSPKNVPSFEAHENIASTNDNNDPRTSSTHPSGYLTVIVGCIMAIAFIKIMFLVAYCIHKTPRSEDGIETNQGLPGQMGQSESQYQMASFITTSAVNNTQQTFISTKKVDCQGPELHQLISELTVERCRVRLSNLLQEGTFGRVYRGTYNDDQDVIVKTVSQHASQMQVSLLLQEGMSLYGASHSGIMSVLGVSIEDHTTPFVLYPATSTTRNLKLFLLEPSSCRSITTIQIVLMSSQLATALDHLHNHGVIHRDIAARNCMIDEHLHVKLSDSSLSRDIFPADYNCLGDSENRPVKWMSLEVLQHKVFSEASDAWAFGVLIWELCTHAKQPYAEVDPFEMEHYLKDGYRLAQPLNCPDELFTFMAYCWALLPIERPRFAQLQVYLSEFHAQITRYV